MLISRPQPVIPFTVKFKTINEIGQEFGVHPVQVSQWKKEIQEQAKTLFEGIATSSMPTEAHFQTWTDSSAGD